MVRLQAVDIFARRDPDNVNIYDCYLRLGHSFNCARQHQLALHWFKQASEFATRVIGSESIEVTSTVDVL